MGRLLAAALALLIGGNAAATGHDYRLAAVRVTDDTWVVPGSTAHFAIANGGNIVNTAFIATAVGAVVIDTGPSARYGAQLRALVERTTGLSVVRVYNTHHHPDHFLGNQAFADVPILALADTRQAMIEQAEAFSDNLYRLLGTWMAGTVPQLPGAEVVPGRETVGGHVLESFAYRGHTAGDLVLLDHTTGVLFAGDLVFNARAPTTPNADLAAWRESLAALRSIEFSFLVCGHGPVATSSAPLAATADYLGWLGGRIDDAVSGGRDMAETLFLPVPARFHDMDTLTDEYRRSVMHVFPRVEQAFFHGEESR